MMKMMPRHAWAGRGVGGDDSPEFQALLRGETLNLPEQESNTVRIFLSSTFTDMKEERNKLTREVFPALRSYCQQRKLEFEVVDMRWGVRDSATADHSTSILCLNEIDRCKRMSQGPYFVGFLGDKYGYRPLKASIPSDTFQKLMDIMSSSESISREDIDLVEKWYVEDTNAVPAVYMLQPITAHLPHYYDNKDDNKQSVARETWWEMFEGMRKVFDKAARLATETGVFSEEEMHTFVMSVTEEEIRHALEGNSNVHDTSLFFIRDFERLEPTYEQRSTISRFADVVVDEESKSVSFLEHPRSLLSRLKTEYISKVVPSSSLNKYSVPWTENGIDPTSCSEHAEYLSKMCNDFENKLKALIDLKQESLKSAGKMCPTKSSLYKELLHHASFGQTKCRAFKGRDDVLEAVQTFLASGIQKPLVIHGVSGSGKTSVMAMVARHGHEWIGRGCVIALRFLGTSAQTSSIHVTLESMCRQIAYAYGVPQPHHNHLEDFSELVQVFNMLIKTLPTKEKPLLLLFDSIDQLNANNNAHKMNWLTKSLSKNAHIVISMLPKEHNCLDNVKLTLTDPACYIGMQAVPPETGIAIINGWLQDRGRRLTLEQLDLVTESFIKCPQPLFLKLLFEEFVTWPSFKEVTQIELPSTVVEAITELFQELEEDHGYIFVAHALGYMTAGKNGLTEAEIEDVLSCDDEVLNDVYQYWDPPVKGVVRIPSSVWKRLRYDIDEFIVERQSYGKTVITWYHRQFIETAKRRYLGSTETKEARHELLAKMFLGDYSNGAIKPIRLEKRDKDFPDADRGVAPQPLIFGDDVFNLRKLQELPYHLMMCNLKDGVPQGIVQHILYNFDWMLTKLRAFNFLELITDFKKFDEESSLVIDALYLSGSNLKEDPFSLAGQLIGCMADLISGHPHIEQLLMGAKDWVQGTDRSLIIPRGACLNPPGGQLITSLSGHPTRVEAIVTCSSSGSVLVTVCRDSNGRPMANVWEESTAELIHTLQMSSGSKANGKLSLAISHDSKYVIFGCQMLGMYELMSAEGIHRLETGEDHAISSLQLLEDDTLAAAGSETGTNIYIWDLQDGNLLTKLQHPEVVRFVSFEGNGDVLSACQDGCIRHWSLKTKECIHIFEAHGKGEVSTIAHAKDIKTLITGGKDGVIKLSKYLDKPSTPQDELKGHKKGISCLLLLPGQRLASGSEDFTVRIWDLANGKAVTQCKGHAGNITCLWYTPVDPQDPQTRPILVSGSKDDLLKVWDIDSLTLRDPHVTTLEGHSSWIADVTGSPGGASIFTASNDKSAKIWDYKRKTVIMREKHNGHSYGLAFTPDKSQVVSSGAEGSVMFWDFRDPKVVRRERGFVICFLMSRNHKKLIGAFKERGMVRVWDIHQSEGNGACYDLEGHQKGIVSMDLGCDDEVVTGSKDMTIKVWRMGDRSCRMTLEGHQAAVDFVKVARQDVDTYIVSGDNKGTFKIWHYTTGECLVSANEHNSAIRCLNISRDAQYAVTGGDDLRVWSLKPPSLGQVIGHLTIHTAEVICAAFTGDGTRIVSGSHTGKEQLHVWYHSRGDESQDYFLEGHSHAIMDLKISADDQSLVTASRDCTMKAWHLPSRTLMASFDNKSQIKHFDMALASEDRYRLAAENKTGTVLLLDLLLPNAERSDVCFQTHPAIQADCQMIDSAPKTPSKADSSQEVGNGSQSNTNGHHTDIGTSGHGGSVSTNNNGDKSSSHTDNDTSGHGSSVSTTITGNKSQSQLSGHHTDTSDSGQGSSLSTNNNEDKNRSHMDKSTSGHGSSVSTNNTGGKSQSQLSGQHTDNGASRPESSKSSNSKGSKTKRSKVCNLY